MLNDEQKKQLKYMMMQQGGMVNKGPDNGKTEIAAVNPVASMLAVDNRDLTEVANEIQEKLQQVIHSL